MKPRWLLFALTLPTDDVIFVQYTVPTIVMSRQCDQTPRVRNLTRSSMGDQVIAKAPQAVAAAFHTIKKQS